MTTSVVLLLRATDTDKSLLLAGSKVVFYVLKQMSIIFWSLLKDLLLYCRGRLPTKRTVLNYTSFKKIKKLLHDLPRTRSSQLKQITPLYFLTFLKFLCNSQSYNWHYWNTLESYYHLLTVWERCWKHDLWKFLIANVFIETTTKCVRRTVNGKSCSIPIRRSYELGSKINHKLKSSLEVCTANASWPDDQKPNVHLSYLTNGITREILIYINVSLVRLVKSFQLFLCTRVSGPLSFSTLMACSVNENIACARNEQ